MIGISKLSWIISIVLHAGLVALLIFGPSLRPTVTPELPQGSFIQAEIVDLDTLDLQAFEEPNGPTAAELERERLEQERVARLAREKLEQEQKDEREREQLKIQELEQENERIRLQAEEAAKEKAEAKKQADEREKERLRLKKIDEDKKEADRVKKQKEDAATKAKELKAKREAERVEKEKAELAAKQKAERLKKEKAELAAQQEAERIRKEKEEKEKAEKARLAKIAADKEKKRKAAAKKALDAQLAREEQMRQMMGVEDQRNKAVDSGLLAQYTAAVIAAVQYQWNRPPSAKEGLSCTVEVSQIPGGEVTRVKVVKCNGDAIVQRSIEAAVLQASPLPEPPDASLFERNLVFIFEPK